LVNSLITLSIDPVRPLASALVLIPFAVRVSKSVKALFKLSKLLVKLFYKLSGNFKFLNAF
jgi:hypothetical protein